MGNVVPEVPLQKELKNKINAILPPSLSTLGCFVSNIRKTLRGTN